MTPVTKARIPAAPRGHKKAGPQSGPVQSGGSRSRIWARGLLGEEAPQGKASSGEEALRGLDQAEIELFDASISGPRTGTRNGDRTGCGA